MKPFSLIKNFFLSLLLKIFPSLSYKGMVDTQINLYKRTKREYPEASEDDVLAMLLDSRRRLLARDPGAHEYYLELMQAPEKSAWQTISAMVEWEYLDDMKSHSIRGQQNIPPTFVENFRGEIRKYVKLRLK